MDRIILSMCTLTFIPLSTSNFVLTSTRDEAPDRDTIAPALYQEKDTALLYPKDAVAGGTWIGASNNNRVICLLNGGFVAHKRAASYKMSRGVLVKKLLGATSVDKEVAEFDFMGIEPFTLIMISWGLSLQCKELVWDGNQLHSKNLSLTPQIWSSSLLYTADAKKMREKWFNDFLKNTPFLTPAQMLKFHTTAGSKQDPNALIMDRGFVKSKSITQIVKLNHEVTMQYQDLETSLITTKSL